jgi:hypothetical protein
MDAMRLPAGVRAYFGAPAAPMPEGLIAAIAELVNSMPEIIEAHLPQCYVPTTTEQPAQVLIVVPTPEADLKHVLESLQEGIDSLVLLSGHLDIWPLPPNSNMLPAIRRASCSLKSVSISETQIQSQDRKWWKLW